MFHQVVMLCPLLPFILVLHQVAIADKSSAKSEVLTLSKVQGKYIGQGYRYEGNGNSNGWNGGYSHGPNHGQGYDGGNGQSYAQGYSGGNGQGYGQDYKRGNSQGYAQRYGNGNGQRHGLRNRGGKGHNDHNNHHAVPIKIPHIDRNGCRFPGDVVCDTITPADPAIPITYSRCLLNDESKNLWKKPTMTVVVVECPANMRVLTEFCNDNERILKAAGLIQDKGKHENKSYHMAKYGIRLDPCILFTP